MKSEFLPQTLSRGSAAACVTVQHGASSTDMHWHDCAEIIHMKRGSALLFAAEEWRTLGEGETVFLPKGHLHCCHCTDGDALRIVIGLGEELIPAAEHRDAAIEPFRSAKIGDSLIFGRDSALPPLFDELEHGSDGGTCAELRQLFTVGRIYLEMLKEWERRGLTFESKPESPIVAKIKEAVATRFSEPISASEMAEQLNISYSYMASLLHRELNTGFGELLLSERISAAKRLLLTTDKSITEIALDCGFTDSSYFIKKFRTHTGTTPYKYRAENLGRIS